MAYQWCEVVNMFCSDMDEEDQEHIGCDGECSDCGYCSEVGHHE